MNLLKETNRRLEYQLAKYTDLSECLEGALTGDCKHYLRGQLDNTTSNIKYYTELLEVLEMKEVISNEF